MDPQGHHPLVLVRRHHTLRHLELDLVAQQPQLLRLRRPRRPGRRRHAVGAAEGASAARAARSNYETQKVFFLRMVLLRYGTQKAKVYQRYGLRALSTLGMINPPMSTRHGVTRCTTVRPI